MTLPFSQHCENNKQAILDIIKPLLTHHNKVLEIGSGTGQHAVFFSKAMPHLIWQSSDLQINLTGIKAQINHSPSPNLLLPIAIDVNQTWPINEQDKFDAVFTANTLHIMHENAIESLFYGIKKILPKNSSLLIYGPFNYGSEFTSESNKVFDQHLKEKDPKSGIRDFETILSLAMHQGFYLKMDYEMPMNNRLLHFEK